MFWILLALQILFLGSSTLSELQLLYLSLRLSRHHPGQKSVLGSFFVHRLSQIINFIASKHHFHLPTLVPLLFTFISPLKHTTASTVPFRPGVQDFGNFSLREGRKFLFRFMAIFKTVLFFGCDT
jgi:hypothetical protein